MNIQIFIRILHNKLPIKKYPKNLKKSKGRNNRISCFSVDLHLKKGQQLTELQNMLVNFVKTLILKQENTFLSFSAF
jgi:hypothetical protein